MNFEKEYYESNEFWIGDMVQDQNNLVRIKITIDSIPKDVNSIADIGCGNGVFINTLIRNNSTCEIVGIDRSKTALKFVNGKTIVGSIDEIPLKDNSYDCVTCLEVIEHLPVNIYTKALEEICRVSRKYIIISVPFNEKIEENYNQCPSCLTIFNYDLHLRTFSKINIEKLLTEFGYTCIEIKTFGKSFKFKGHYLFRKLFYSKQFKQWKSPICPVCGYTNKKTEFSNRNDSIAKRSIISYLTQVPKLFWPKEEKNYWILGVYKKK